MLFENHPGVYKRITQGVIVMAMVSSLRCGSEFLKKDGNPKYWIFPPLVLTSFALGSNHQYKILKNQGDKYDSKWLEKSIETI